MNINDFKSKLGVNELPSELENLIEFAFNLSDSEYFSDGFFIEPYGRIGLATWSSEEDFINKLIPFATANSTGSIYAIWVNDSNQSLSKIPIVVFGDEGGEHIVAENILQFLQLLTYDTEIELDEYDVRFVKEKDKESKNLKKYLNWLKENYNLEKIEEPEKIIKIAQEKYKQTLDKWISKYVK
jgi:hypothetical protein